MADPMGHRVHMRLHEEIGVVAVLAALALLVAGMSCPLINPILSAFSWIPLIGGAIANMCQPIDINTALFNISVILVALTFPIKEKDRAHDSEWLQAYGGILIAMAAVMPFLILTVQGQAITPWTYIDAYINPATITLFVGGIVSELVERAGKDASFKQRVGEMFLILLVLFGAIWFVPLDMIPEGQVRDTASAIKDVQRPFVELFVAFADWQTACMEEAISLGFGEYQRCTQEHQNSIMTAARNIPGGGLLMDGFAAVWQAGLDYSAPMRCIGQSGGGFLNLYEQDPETATDTSTECMEAGENPFYNPESTEGVGEDGGNENGDGSESDAGSDTDGGDGSDSDGSDSSEDSGSADTENPCPVDRDGYRCTTSQRCWRLDGSILENACEEGQCCQTAG